MAANQRNQLICRDQKCDRIYKSNQSQNHKSSQPIRISRCEKFFENAFVVSHFILLTSTRTELQQRSTRMNNPKPVACSRALTLSVMRFSFPAFSQGSSVVEQGTHKPLVGSSNLPPGIPLLLGFRKVWLYVLVAAADRSHEANAAVLGHRTCPAFLMNITPAREAQHCSGLAVSLRREKKELHAFLRNPDLSDRT